MGQLHGRTGQLGFIMHGGPFKRAHITDAHTLQIKSSHFKAAAKNTKKQKARVAAAVAPKAQPTAAPRPPVAPVRTTTAAAAAPPKVGGKLD